MTLAVEKMIIEDNNPNLIFGAVAICGLVYISFKILEIRENNKRKKHLQELLKKIEDRHDRLMMNSDGINR